MRASNWKRLWEALDWNSESILAVLINKGCMHLFPVITDTVVLSEERIVPRRVAPSGKQAYRRYKRWLLENTITAIPACSTLDLKKARRCRLWSFCLQ